MKNNAGVMADRLIQQAEDCKEPALQIKLYELAARYAQVEAFNRVSHVIKEMSLEINGIGSALYHMGAARFGD